MAEASSLNDPVAPGSDLIGEDRSTRFNLRTEDEETGHRAIFNCLLRETTMDFALMDDVAHTANDAVNKGTNRLRWDEFVGAGIERLKENILALNIPVKKKLCYTRCSGENIWKVEPAAAIYMKGGAAYMALDERMKTTTPRTHDYDISICVDSVQDLLSTAVKDFFWRLVRDLEPILDLDKCKDSFERIDRHQPITASSDRGELLLSGPPDDCSGERTPGGPSDYLFLTSFSNPSRGFVNYRVNGILAGDQRRSVSGKQYSRDQIVGKEGTMTSENDNSYDDCSRSDAAKKIVHLVEFIFTDCKTDFDHLDYILCLPYEPKKPTPNSSSQSTSEGRIYRYIPNVTSLIKYTLYAMVSRGFQQRVWKKCRQDYSRLKYFLGSRSEEILARYYLADRDRIASLRLLFGRIVDRMPHCAMKFSSSEEGDSFFRSVVFGAPGNRVKREENMLFAVEIITEIGFREQLPFYFKWLGGQSACLDSDTPAQEVEIEEPSFFSVFLDRERFLAEMEIRNLDDETVFSS